MAGLFETLADLITRAFDPDAGDTLPAAPEVIADVGQWLSDLKDNSVSVDADLGTLRRLLDKFNPPDSPGFADSVLMRMLEHRWPRVAGLLVLLGVIEYDATPPSHHRIRWDRVQQLLTAPQSVLPVLEAKAGLPDPATGAVNSHLLTVQLAALVVAPRPLLLLEHTGRGTGALPVPPSGPLALADDSPLHDLFEAPWLFKLQIPPPAALADLRPDAAGVDAFLAYLHSQDLHPENLLPDLSLPTLPAPSIESPPLLLPKLTPGSLKLGLALVAHQPSELVKSYPIAAGWQLVVVGPTVPFGANLVFDGTSWTLADVLPPSLPDDLVAVRLQRTNPVGPVPVVSTPVLTIDVAELSAFAQLRRPAQGNGPFSLGLHLAGLRVALQSSYLEGLGIGQALQALIDLDVVYDAGRGLRVQGGEGEAPALGIDLVQPINQRLGGSGLSLTIDSARLRLAAAVAGSGLALRAEVRLSVTGELGPVTATITDFGAWVGLSGGQSLGPLAPSGIGLSVDAGPVQGGGFLAESPPDSGRFLGALSVKVLGVGVGAFGILEVRPGRSPSFVVVVGARFPGIQLGFGLMLTGIGGVVGINRRTDLDQLSARLSSGSAGNVLFCEDPVRNAPAIFDDLAAFFPAADGVFVVGPTFQIVWLYIVRLDVGVLVELPGPSKIIIVGSARATIPGLGSAVPLVNLRVDMLGGIDFAASLVFFDASLVDSSVLAIFTLTGDATFRMSYGASPYVLLSIGGFHPSYNPEPIKIRRLQRASAGYSIDAGVHIYLRSTFYFAFTPNTLQLGAGVEAGLEIGPVAAHGHFEFDALVQFRPFYFEFILSAGFDIEFDDVSLCSVSINGKVSGPGPLVIAAAVSFKILFVRFSFDTTYRLGSGNGDVPRVDIAVLDELAKEVHRLDNIHTENTERQVILKKITVKDVAVVAATATVVWTQRLAPFEIRLQRFGGTPLSQQYQVSLDSAVKGDPVREPFGLGSYADVSGAEALNTAAFHREIAGIALSTGVSPGGTEMKRTVKITVIKIPDRSQLLNASMWGLSAALAGATGKPDGTAAVAAAPPLVSVRDETWNAHAGDGALAAAGVSAFGAFQAARGTGGLAVPAGEALLDLAGV
ncbi:hypothetical protein GCM10009841_29020 [Microlunatus panaciterrae]|uniref:DUF6603 domain-containing protein n=1 Tax=Microlunatus panaciterrae TaxID=400768 RepID=A0ABS2RGA4_9ACTN|nr:DUF6603 domain-containing protein [Microlunatus panaciterrae]MBM7797562.1 hypothetical protein [Microlunatus panaciterrae]